MKPLMVVGLLLGLSSCLWADYTVPLAGGAVVQLKYQNFDEGTIYGGLANGFYDEAALHPAVDPFTRPKGSNVGEDGWGIFLMDRIVDMKGKTLWAPAANEEISGIFWGLHDEQMIQSTVVGGISPGTHQEIRSTGLKFAFYYDTTPDFDSGDPAVNRVLGANGVYQPFFKSTTPGGWDDTDGKLIWTGYSVPGFIAGDASNEFMTDYNYTKNTSAGGFYGDLGSVNYVDGTGATQTLTGSDNGQFTLWQPSGPGGAFANFQFQFTGVPGTGTSWLLKSNDPIGGVVTPELPSSALLLFGLVPLGLGWMRRKRA